MLLGRKYTRPFSSTFPQIDFKMAKRVRRLKYNTTEMEQRRQCTD